MVTYDKNYLCMMTQVCKISQDQGNKSSFKITNKAKILIYLSIVKLKNTGSTTVTYEWKKIERGDYI